MERAKTAYVLGIVRISLGLMFFWAFLDKTFGLGLATLPEKAWISGGSPTLGYLKFGVSGPLASIFHSLAGQPVIDWLFMVGLFAVGLTLILGVLVRLGSIAGIAMLTLMFVSNLPPENHPFLDDHLIYILVLLLILSGNSTQKFGWGKMWQGLALVQKNKFLE